MVARAAARVAARARLGMEELGEGGGGEEGEKLVSRVGVWWGGQVRGQVGGADELVGGWSC